MACQLDSVDSTRIRTIEWEMMDKKRLFPFILVNNFAVCVFMYPLTVVKTRLQIQQQTTLYKGTFDAFFKILKHEGARGLYRGYWFSTIHIASNMGYITTYESVKHALSAYAKVTNRNIKGLIGGGCASIVSQTIITPVDVISQHMMVFGHLKNKNAVNSSVMNPLNINPNSSRTGLAFAVIQEIYKKDGMKGFYRGYCASLCSQVPSSALWWMFYPVYSDLLISLAPSSMPYLLMHCFGGQMSSISVAVIINPLDVIRTRIQIYRMNSIFSALSKVWYEEGIAFLSKGLSARMIQSFISSFLFVLSYEALKRFSVSAQYKDHIRW